MRVPTLLVVVADNQQGVARELESHGAAESLGSHIDASRIAAALQRLAADRERRTQFSQRGRELVDGRGAERVLDVLRTLGTGGHGYRVLLRRATEQDALAFLRLANDPGVRAQAFHPERIELDAHMRWFRQKLASRESALWVIELGGVVAAQVRYDRTDDNTAEIGYAVASAFRGMGLGTRILELTWRLACQVLSVSVVRGVVISGNIASARAFEKAGFSPAGECELHGRSCLSFERRVTSPAGVL
jgi:UDP-2,4-diacetamido-2,4,6-trideoxy-beta-L-altropyranose hydrolase